MSYIVDDLREEIERLQERVRELERENNALRRDSNTGSYPRLYLALHYAGVGPLPPCDRCKRPYHDHVQNFACP